jgi:hypothetical protein
MNPSHFPLPRSCSSSVGQYRWVLLWLSSEFPALRGTCAASTHSQAPDTRERSERRVLRFELDKVFATETSLHLMLGLCGREEGAAQVDRLSEESHKKAAGISKRLKYNVREAIEILGNEAVWFLREIKREKVYGVVETDKLALSACAICTGSCSFSTWKLARSLAMRR